MDTSKDSMSFIKHYQQYTAIYSSQNNWFQYYINKTRIVYMYECIDLNYVQIVGFYRRSPKYGTPGSCVMYRWCCENYL